MAITPVAIKARTKGKATREVTYNGVGKYVMEPTEKRDENDKIVRDKEGKPVMVDVPVLKTAGVVTDIADALEFENGDMQSLLDNWAVGKNLELYKGVSDALSEYIQDSWTKEQVSAFRLIVNNLQKLPDVSLEEAIQLAVSKMPKS